MDSFPAHVRTNADKSKDIQSVSEHLRNTALWSSELARGVGLESTLNLLGWIHDIGKYTDDFKTYITKAANGDKVTRGSVNHTFAGVQLLLKRFHNSATFDMKVVANEIMAYACGAHHGLFDCINEAKESQFEKRLNDKSIHFKDCENAFFEYCISENDLELLYDKAITELLQKLCSFSSVFKTKSNCLFATGLLSRMLCSYLVEGDRRDTAEFMTGISFSDTTNLEKWISIRDKVESKISCLNRDGQATLINQSRAEISRLCKEAAKMPTGIYRLNVPTGAGKTLSSLRYALNHVIEQGKERIIFTTPLLSILEQNADVIRQYIEDDGMILEHHSNVLREYDAKDELSDYEMLTDTWSAPIIITTLVQLLNTLFSGKTSSIRRFHALCNSVVVIDEVQTVPSKMLSMFNQTITFLSKYFGTTFILCSATQPALEKAARPVPFHLPDLVEHSDALWAPFHRTKLINKGSMQLNEIASFAKELISRSNSVLIVCNRKDEASTLLKKMPLDGVKCFHLSSSMCPAHRRMTLQEMKRCLEVGEKLICFSTQVIEAGVDISFNNVIRLCAGMDSIVQAAGRCNRNGESSSLAEVYLIPCDNENLQKLNDIQDGKTATISLIAAYEKDPTKFMNNLMSDEAIAFYYQTLYAEMKEGAQDYPTKEETLYKLLSDGFSGSRLSKSGSKYYMRQALKTAGSLFEVFDESSETVIVPWQEGASIINDLENAWKNRDYKKTSALLQKAKQYSITVYKYQMEQLQESGLVFSILDGAANYVSLTCYHSLLGLQIPNTNFGGV